MKSQYFFHISLSLALAFLSSMRFAQTPSTKNSIRIAISTLRYGSFITPSIISIVMPNTPNIVNLFLNQNLIVFFFIIVLFVLFPTAKIQQKNETSKFFGGFLLNNNYFLAESKIILRLQVILISNTESGLITDSLIYRSKHFFISRIRRISHS